MVDEPALVAGQRGQRAHQADGVGMLRVLEDLAHRTVLDDAAGIHDRDFVGDFRDDAEIVRDEQERHPRLALEIADEVEDLRLDGHVERRRGLVGDQQLRAVWPAPSRS